MAKKRLVWGLGVFLALAVVGGLLDAVGIEEEAQNRSDQRPDPISDDPPAGGQRHRGDRAPDGEERRRADAARVVEVIDGDTVDLERLGRVRLVGVDTPEDGRCFESQATGFTRRRIGGKTVRYELGAETRDRYGRVLAYLYRGNRMHNLELVKEGYAKVLTIPPNDRYAGRFRRAERASRRAGGGLWGACLRPRPRPRRVGSLPSVPAPPPDLDCPDVGHPVRVGPGDPHRLDGDGDGIGCD